MTGVFRFRAALLAVAVALLLAVGASDAFAQSPCPSDDENLDYNCPVGPTYLVPGLTDLNGWKERSHYRNILVGDLDNDKVDELVVRGIAGIEVYRWQPEFGQWARVRTNPILSDNDGFWDRQYYETIRLGDLDGDGDAELVARASAGIVVYKYARNSPANPDNAGWTQVTFPAGDPPNGVAYYPMSDAAGWGTDPSFYSTIQLTPLGRQDPAKPTMQLIGRGGEGLEMWEWIGTGWRQLRTLGELSNEGGWNVPQHYTSIMPWDTDTLVTRAASGLQIYTYTKGTTAGDIGSWKPEPTANQVLPNPQVASSYETMELVRGAGPRPPTKGVSGPVVLWRGTGGIQLFNWTGSEWDALLAGSLPLSDNDGFDIPRYRRTIQAADVNGDGRDEVLARGSTGMLIARISEDGKGWNTPLSVGTPALADKPWSRPEYYGTIKTAKLDPASNARWLIARGPHGIRTWRYDTAAKQWTRPKPYGSYPALDPTAYNALNMYLNTQTLAGGVRDFYAKPGADSTGADLASFESLIAETCDGRPESVNPRRYDLCVVPSEVGTGVDPGAWTDVANQIMAELYWARQVNSHFDTIAGIQAALFPDEAGEFSAITDKLHVDEAENVIARVDYEALFANIFRILSAIPDIGPVFGITASALGLAETASPTVAKTSPFDNKVADLAVRIVQIQEEAQDANSHHRSHVLSDYGLLSTVGRLTGSRIWTLDKAAALSAGRQGFTKWIYQQYLPLLWDHWRVGRCNGVDTTDQANCAGPPGFGMSYWKLFNDGVTRDTLLHHADFEGLVPRQDDPCSSSYREEICSWKSLEAEHFGATIRTLAAPISDECKYVPGKHDWVYGTCTLGVPFPELYSDAWGFRSFSCDVDSTQNVSKDPCGSAKATHVLGDVVPPANAAVRGAQSPRSRRSRVDLSITAPLERDIDLRRGKVTLGRLLYERGGARELLDRRAGKDLTPATLRLKRGAKRHRARFETSRDRSPRIRGSVAVQVRKERVGRGRARRVRRVHTLRVEIRVERALLQRPEACDSRGITQLGVHLVVRDRRGRPAQVLGTHPWRCGKGGRLRHRSSQSRARVGRSRVQVRGRTASIPLRCHNRGRLPCRGTIVLSARFDGAPATATGRGRFSIRAGRRTTVRVRLYPRARRALASRRRLAVTARLVTRHSSGLELGHHKKLVLLKR